MYAYRTDQGRILGNFMFKCIKENSLFAAVHERVVFDGHLAAERVPSMEDEQLVLIT